MSTPDWLAGLLQSFPDVLWHMPQESPLAFNFPFFICAACFLPRSQGSLLVPLIKSWDHTGCFFQQEIIWKLARAERGNSTPLSPFIVSGMTGLTLRLYHLQLFAQTAVSDLYVCGEYNKTVSLINMCCAPPSVRQADSEECLHIHSGIFH